MFYAVQCSHFLLKFRSDAAIVIFPLFLVALGICIYWKYLELYHHFNEYLPTRNR